MDRQCSSCGGFCKKSGCEREDVHEPVAWRFQSPTGGWAYAKEPPIGFKYAAEPLYIHLAQRTWVGLTTEDIKVIEDNALSKQMAILMTDATLKEKNT